MKTIIKKIINKFLNLINLKIIKLSTFETISKLPRSFYVYAALPKEKQEKIFNLLGKSKSQLGQDILVSAYTELDKENFFVEFGATNGITHSNTHLLEKELNWKGILVEPASIWHDELDSNRNCFIDKRCIFTESGKIMEFLTVANQKKDGEIIYNGIDPEPGLSSLKKYADNGDWASKVRLKNSKKEIVETITLNDLLDFYDAPKIIDYMSIDSEGSELDILKSFDFSKRKICIISVEHNYHPINRKKINFILEKVGYKRIYQNLSKFDDWYIMNNG